MKNHWTIVLILLSMIMIRLTLSKSILVHGTKQRKGKLFMVIEDAPKKQDKSVIHSETKRSQKTNRKLKIDRLSGLLFKKPNRGLDLTNDERDKAIKKGMIGGALGAVTGYGVGKLYRDNALKELNNLKVASEYLKIINEVQGDASEKLKDVKNQLSDAVAQAKSQTNALIDQLEANSSHITF